MNDDEFLKPEDIPLCPCGDIFDRQNGVGEWFHSQCRPDAKQRAKRTLEVLERREKILARKT
jgi:hypothetical protein